MPLRTSARCLRGIASRFWSASAVMGLPERGVARPPHPILAPRREIAELDMGDAEAPGQLDRGLFERGARGGLGRGDAAVDAERRRDERVAQQQAPLARERQHTVDLPAGFGEQVVHRLPERAREHRAPGRAVEERGFRAVVHEAIPARDQLRGCVQLERADVHGRAWCAMSANHASGQRAHEGEAAIGVTRLARSLPVRAARAARAGAASRRRLCYAPRSFPHSFSLGPPPP
jgi:hypothetical protein